MIEGPRWEFRINPTFLGDYNAEALAVEAALMAAGVPSHSIPTDYVDPELYNVKNGVIKDIHFLSIDGNRVELTVLIRPNQTKRAVEMNNQINNPKFQRYNLRLPRLVAAIHPSTILLTSEENLSYILIWEDDPRNQSLQLLIDHYHRTKSLEFEPTFLASEVLGAIEDLHRSYIYHGGIHLSNIRVKPDDLGLPFITLPPLGNETLRRYNDILAKDAELAVFKDLITQEASEIVELFERAELLDSL
jgi:hypothetical protein